MKRFLLIAALLAGSATAGAQGRGAPPPPPPPPPPSGGPPLTGPPPAAPTSPAGRGGNGSSSGAGSNAARPAGQFGPVGRWWDDKSVVRTVGISHEQQKKMDTIFDAHKGAILATYKTYLGEKAKLDELSRQTNVDQAKLFAAIDSVSQAKAALQKANTQMLLEIRGQMQPGQVEKLEELQ